MGTDDDGDFDTLLHSLDSAKTFDILMFRGSDFVSDANARVSKGHGADFFSHVGMVVNTKPRLANVVPRWAAFSHGGVADQGASAAQRWAVPRGAERHGTKF